MVNTPRTVDEPQLNRRQFLRRSSNTAVDAAAAGSLGALALCTGCGENSNQKFRREHEAYLESVGEEGEVKRLITVDRVMEHYELAVVEFSDGKRIKVYTHGKLPVPGEQWTVSIDTIDGLGSLGYVLGEQVNQEQGEQAEQEQQ